MAGMGLLVTQLSAGSNTISAVRIASSINPVVASFISQEIESANSSGSAAFLLELDTPGGLDSSMRDIIQEILGSHIPVIVYVYPSGARAASAGAIITLSADFAVMAPGTNLGAAHPVAIGGGGQGGMDETMQAKVVNDAVAYAKSIARQKGRNEEWAENIVRESISTPASEALELKVIDLIAENEKSLLENLDGRKYLRDGKAMVLNTADVVLTFAEMNWRQQILNTISNPNVAYMLLMLGIMGIFFEISQPGVILPGAVGVLALLLAFIGLQMLPVNYVGVLLIVLAVVLFVLEVKVVSFGMLTIGGIVSLVMGSLVLIDGSEPYQQISLAVIVASVSVFSSFFLLALYFVVRTQRRPAVSGIEGMVGERGEAATDFNGEGRVFVHSEYWSAVSNEPIVKGDKIEIVKLADHLKLEVRKIDRTYPVAEEKIIVAENQED
jgi:membrane-bound serine protease (ClpP class)